MAHELAYYHITDRTVTASCIAVLEMLGETSLTLRTHVATVNHIMPFFKNGLFGKKETKEPSGMSLVKLVYIIQIQICLQSFSQFAAIEAISTSQRSTSL